MIMVVQSVRKVDMIMVHNAAGYIYLMVLWTVSVLMYSRGRVLVVIPNCFKNFVINITQSHC